MTLPACSTGRRLLRAVACALSVLIPLSFNTGFAAAAEDRDAQLARVRARLQSLQTELNATRTKRDAVHEEISALERKIGTLLNEQRTTDKRLQLEEQRMKALREQAS